MKPRKPCLSANRVEGLRTVVRFLDSTAEQLQESTDQDSEEYANACEAVQWISDLVEWCEHRKQRRGGAW